MTRDRQPSLDQVVSLFRMFGVDIVNLWQRCQTTDQKIEAFQQAKRDAKLAYRRLAMEHHPDRGGDAEQIKSINAAWSKLENLEMRARPPQRRSALTVHEARQGHTVVFVGVVTAIGDTTSTTGSSPLPWDTHWRFGI